MVTVLDVGGYVYRRLGWIDAWRIEKLAYLTQAWHLAWDGRPLFDQDFEAWPEGPVAMELYRVNKYERPSRWSTELPGANPDALSSFSRAVVDAVLDHYGKMSREELITLTHHDEPWKQARAGLGQHTASSQVLAKSEIRRCYSLRASAGGSDIPKPPQFAPAGVIAGPTYQVSVDHQIDRWADALALLAER